MNPISRYSNLVVEFEQKLGRKITDEEDHFVRWMVEQEIESTKKSLKTATC